ncbi:hypothetical protein [Methanobrevibacter sp.]|uniref:hypothetical protein n=1 Tax=Methanobrevibacter sp. TaxID=66852 RepID=UPI0025F61373|nr:hypothetical protein [Methanobrevibacter sp.]MBR4448303.1 hypothetical protein [Methanobrevibacter sp.]
MKLRFLSLIFVAALLLATVSASENISYSNESENITFEGVNFTIPAGFGESKDVEDFDELGSYGKSCFYVNEANGEIIITVISDWMGMNVDEFYKEGAVESTVNGHTGWNYTEDDLHYFGYVHDDKGILIGVTNETRLYEIVL